MLLVALLMFALGSCICGLAQSLLQLIVGRVIQALGGGGLMTLSQALIGELVAPRQRVKYQAYFAAIFTTASLGGPVLGGLVVAQFSWRWIFFSYLPLCALAIWRLAKLPSGDRHPDPSNTTDYIGIALFAIGTLASLYWLTSVGHRFSWSSVESAFLIAVGVIGLSLLVWNERRHASPFLPIDLLRNRQIAFSVISTSLYSACLFAMIFFLPIYLQLGYRVGATHSGLLLLPLTVGSVVGSWITGRVVARTGEPKRMLVLGLSVSSLSLFLLGALPANATVVVILGIAAGTGFGTVMPVTQVVTQVAAGRARLGTMMAMLSLFRSFGGASGTALFGALVYALMPDLNLRSLASLASDSQALSVTHAFRIAFICAALVAAAGALTASRIPRMKI
jgi:MFS family permease